MMVWPLLAKGGGRVRDRERHVVHAAPPVTVERDPVTGVVAQQVERLGGYHVIVHVDELHGSPVGDVRRTINHFTSHFRTRCRFT